MALDRSPFHVSLSNRKIFTLPDAAGVGIECRSGTVWLTLDHDPRDIVLETGERFDGDTHRRVLVSALGSACITVSDPRRPAAPEAVSHRAHRWSPWRSRSRGMSPA